MRDLTKGSVLKSIFFFSIPVFFSFMLQLCYSLTDTRIVGSFLGDTALAAVGATTVLFNLNINFWTGMANGFGVYIARFFGARDEENVHKTLAGSLMLGLSTTLVIMGLELIFINPILDFLNVPVALIPMAKQYIMLIIAGSLFTTLYNICTAALRGIGDSVTPLIILLLSVALNILGDVLLLVVLHTGVWGAAAATVFSQLLAAVICLIYMLRRYGIFHMEKSDFTRPDPEILKGMYALGMSMAFMSTLVNMGSLILQTSINNLGDRIIVAHTAARRATELFMVMFIVFGQTMATFSGQNFGAGQYERIRQGLKAVHIMSLISCALVIALSYAFSPWIVHMITGSQDETVINWASRYLRFDTLFYFVCAVICIDRNTLQGMDEKIVPLFSSMLELVGKIILALTLVPRIGYWGVIVTEPIVWVIMVVPLILRLRKLLRAE